MINIDINRQIGALHLEVDFSLEQGEVVSLFGPSGCGKSSVLRMVAGLEQAGQGKVVCGKVSWWNSETGLATPSAQRSVSMVFQDYALFPNMTVMDHLKFAGPSAEFDFGMLLTQLGLIEVVGHLPNQLSGGQRQRVAIAMALVRPTDILLLDEPFSAMDSELTDQVLEAILKVTTVRNQSVLLVTHDQQVIVRCANRVVRLDNGSVLRSGTPAEVFNLNGATTYGELQGRILTVGNEKMEVLIGDNIVRCSPIAAPVGTAVFVQLNNGVFEVRLP